MSFCHGYLQGEGTGAQGDRRGSLLQLLADGTMNERAAYAKPLLEVKNLKKYFPIKGGIFSKTVGHVYAVDGVSFFL